MDAFRSRQPGLAPAYTYSLAARRHREVLPLTMDWMACSLGPRSEKRGCVLGNTVQSVLTAECHA
jgi:hypothetical protein